MKSYWGRWSLIFGRNLKWKFGCTSTSNISMIYHSNQTCRVCFKILGTCRFWNCHCFLDLIMISWRNHCLENVNLQCRRGITPSFVPLDLHFSVYLSLHVNASYTTELVAMASYHMQGTYRLGDNYWWYYLFITIFMYLDRTWIKTWTWIKNSTWRKTWTLSKTWTWKICKWRKPWTW